MKHRFLPGSEAEYLEAVRFYQERRSGLGESLIADFEHTLGLALERPESWRKVHASGIRRIGLSRFPYSIFYRIKDGFLEVTAIAHHRKRPGYWLSRLRQNV